MSTLKYQNLTDIEKLILVEDIWESIKKEKIDFSDEFKIELDRRLKAYKYEKKYSWEEVKTLLHS